jgi:hypothetical protein
LLVHTYHKPVRRRLPAFADTVSRTATAILNIETLEPVRLTALGRMVRMFW